MNDVLKRIITELKEKKLKQKDLTDYLNISENCFGSWKRDANQSYLKYLHGIAQFLGVSVEYLRGETDIKNPSTSGEGTDIILTAQEIELIKAYRAKPEMHSSIHKLLDIADETALAEDMAQMVTETAHHPIGKK